MNFEAMAQGCDPTTSGVDINRNYGYNFGEGDNKEDPCSETYRGKGPFSEPETRNMRDFLTKNKDDIKFVYNFHSFGNKFVIPFNGKFPNDLMTQNPKIHEIFDEIVQEAQFNDGEDIGPSTETMGIQAGGDAGDWITY